MANFIKALNKTLRWEGGISNNALDSGGLSNKGITMATFSAYYSGGADALRHITDEQVQTIYRTGYWNKIKGDGILSQSIAELLFDFAVNSGTKTAVRKIQGIVGVEDDGILGKITLQAINDGNQKEIFNKLKTSRINFYNSIVRNKPSQKVFLNGWLRRANSFEFES